MKKYLVILTCVLTAAFASCEKDDVENVRERDEKRLEELYNEIKEISESVTCEDAGEWEFTAIGSKACGGPTGYIAYSNTIDTEAFLEKVKLYTELQQQFNIDWEITSDCSVVAKPSGVICNDEGKPEFVYNNMVPNE
ncbi:hypothetical protein [Albibacterium indicum]|uniref:hypothetical protein n=1 Tax=Albibacterium indicum TaxID=2292082 RepID=UPI000E46F70D|nr:hypothetical protein [Pedobacter indicus]